MKYHKERENYKHREDLIKLLPSKVTKVLDIGCGIGMMGEGLKNKGVEIVGIEKDPGLAKDAAKNLDKIIVGDIEEITLPFEKGYFDCIIFGDVLEHVIDPWKVLKKCKDYLKNEGYYIASIPNISHYRIIKNLLMNKWEYENSGLMDRSHLRYFTLNTIKELFQQAGFKIIDVKYHLRASRFAQLLNLLTFTKLTYLLVEQYLVVACKSEKQLPSI